MTHHDVDSIQASAVDAGDGWQKATIELEAGDTAEPLIPQATWDYAGPGTVEYFFHRRVSTARPGEGVFQLPRS